MWNERTKILIKRQVVFSLFNYNFKENYRDKNCFKSYIYETIKHNLMDSPESCYIYFLVFIIKKIYWISYRLTEFYNYLMVKIRFQFHTKNFPPVFYIYIKFTMKNENWFHQSILKRKTRFFHFCFKSYFQRQKTLKNIYIKKSTTNFIRFFFLHMQRCFIYIFIQREKQSFGVPLFY